MPLIYSPRQGSYWLPAEIRPSITSISTSTRSMSSARPARRKAAKIARSYGTTAAMTHLTATTSVRSIAVVDLALYAISTAALLLLARRAYSTFDMSWDAIAYHMAVCRAQCRHLRRGLFRDGRIFGDAVPRPAAGGRFPFAPVLEGGRIPRSGKFRGARTQRLRGVCMEPQNGLVAGAEAVLMVARKMSSAAMRGTVALPGSKTTPTNPTSSLAKSSHRQ